MPFASHEAANAAVARYRSCRQPEARGRLANDLFLRHLRLVRKTLARFCSRSRCYPGACLVEDLVGETYPLFRRALDEYEPSFGLDFVGFASRRLYWGLERTARSLNRAARLPSRHTLPDPSAPWFATEERALNTLLARQLLARLDAKDAALVALRYAGGYTCRELADSDGMTAAALRKRLERVRGRLRGFATPPDVPTPAQPNPRSEARS